MYHVTYFFNFENFQFNMDRIWQWRHRTWPEAEKSSAQYKFAIDYDKKRIKSISLTSFEKKIQNWPSLKKKSTLVSARRVSELELEWDIEEKWLKSVVESLLESFIWFFQNPY